MNKINLNVQLDKEQVENLRKEISAEKENLSKLLNSKCLSEKRVFLRYMSIYLNQLFEETISKSSNDTKETKNLLDKRDSSINIVPDEILKSVNVGF